ncbi:MAG: response regulator [Alphaproteobacteria bacterium]|nr:response regulator [Alphaproteobacteria bacterium]
MFAPDHVFEAAPDPTILLTADGAPLAANAAFRASFRQAVTVHRPPWGRVVPPPFADGQRTFDAAAPDGRRFEWRERQLPDGRRIAVARDVTERVRAADEAARAKTLLFATLTHELRTPLNGIIGMAGLLARSDLDPAQRDWVDAVTRSGEHLLDLITEILDYSRLEAGRIALEDAPFDPEDTAQGVIELLSPKAHAKGLEIMLAPHPRLPGRLRGDDGRVRQILFNLIGNAVKFTESGGVTVEIAPAPGRSDGRCWLRFSVRDTGPGIPLEKQDMIFEEFQQADASHARRYGGAGLGLAIVRRLATAMGGAVGVTSRVGIGSTFHADIPFEDAAAHAPMPKLEGVRVKIETPSPILAEGVRAVVEGCGGRMTATAPYDVVLVDDAEAGGDLRPWLSGSAPVIVLAPQEERTVLQTYRGQGADHYLLKPLRRRSLAERILVAAKGLKGGRGVAQEERRTAPATSLNLRVLLAEDNPVNALLARTLLTRAGCVVEVVSDGEQAVTAAARGGWDVILLDLRMPMLDGLGAARRIRLLRGDAGRTPIVALTADVNEEDRQAALAAGMDDFVTKPIDPVRLETALMRLSDRRKVATLAAS